MSTTSSPGTMNGKTGIIKLDDTVMTLHEKLILHDCPYCGGAGLLEEEQGWCWYAMCLDCGAQTAQIEYKKPE